MRTPVALDGSRAELTELLDCHASDEVYSAALFRCDRKPDTALMAPRDVLE